MQLPVYMDYHATTPVDSRVLEAMLPFFTKTFGNPASRQHQYGWEADEAVASARDTLASAINAAPKEIVFTSGATESNNLALKGIAETYKKKGTHIVTVVTEHKSVLDSSRHLEKLGYKVTYLPVDEYGLVDLDMLTDAIGAETILVSVMAANNETGVLQDIRAIGQICREKEVFFHTDATQALGKVPLDVQSLNIDLMSFSGHKIYGPKGVGALFVRQTARKPKLAIQMDGGGHERGMRSGTLNVPGIIGLSKAVDIAVKGMEEESGRTGLLRDKLFSLLTKELNEVYLNGHPDKRLYNNLNVSFLHAEDNALMMSMKDVAVSTGSACSTGSPEPSYVLKAMRLPQERLHSAIRFGLGRFTTDEEVEYVSYRVVASVKKLRELSPGYRKQGQPVVQV